ncbi:MAG TPA: N-formylglutamate amidohydrolase [Stellaceae bacterium]|nr:N-formylglutamate amidohydrolase [Stellaceae bacterium]
MKLPRPADIMQWHDPVGAAIPLVFDSPHSGRVYPEDFRYACDFDRLRQAEDSYVDELFAAAPKLGATLIAAQFPRSYIDANRSALDIDESLLATPWTGPMAPSEKTRLGLGLIWRLIGPNLSVYDRKLPVSEVRHRIEHYHTPYHAALDAVTDAMHRRFGVVWHINCHSMPGLSSALSAEGPGIPRADFVLGDRDGSTCAPELTTFVAAVLSGLGYHVRINEPYKGVELVRRHGRPAEHRHSLQIEVNRRLYMDEITFEKLPEFGKVQGDIATLIAELARFARH